MISIIIPVYNVQDYLRECLDSIVSQENQNYEVVLVDDGSTDNSPDICDEYCNKHPQFRVIHKKNGGVSSARNVGLDEAKGDWIWFVDADDWIERNALKELEDTISKHDCDTIFHGLVRVDNNGLMKKYLSKKDFDSPKNVFLEKYYCFQNGMLLFNAGIIRNKDLRYTEDVKMGEDLEFQYKYLIHCKKPISIGRNFYFYRYRDGSAISNNESLINNMRNNFQNVISLLKYVHMEEGMTESWFCKRIQLMLKAAVQSGAKMGTKERKYVQSELSSIKRFVKDNNMYGIFDLTLHVASLNMTIYSILLTLFLMIRR